MENMLNAIQDMPLKAAYYMGKRDAYRKELADMFDERFAEEMGWV